MKYKNVYLLFCFFKDLKLNTMKTDLLPMIVQLLYQLATDLKLDEYVYHYWKDNPHFCNRNYIPLGVSYNLLSTIQEIIIHFVLNILLLLL